MQTTTFYYLNNELIEIISTKQLVIHKKWNITKIDLTPDKRKEVRGTLNTKLEDLNHKRSKIQKKIRKTFLKKMYYSGDNVKQVKYIKRSRKLQQKSKKINLYINKLELIINSLENMIYITEKGKLLGESIYYPAKERNIRNNKRILQLQKKELELLEREKVEYIPIIDTDYMTINPEAIFNLGEAKRHIQGSVSQNILIKPLGYA